MLLTARLSFGLALHSSLYSHPSFVRPIAQLPGGGDELFCARLIQNNPLSGVRRAKASSGKSTTGDDSNSADDSNENVSATLQAKVWRCPVGGVDAFQTLFLYVHHLYIHIHIL